MKKWICATALAFLGGLAHADLYTSQIAISSDVWSNIVVSSLTPTRVDNLDRGTTGYLLNGRDTLTLTLPKNSPSIGCAYTLAAATSTTGTPAVVLSTFTAASLGAEYDASSSQSYRISLPIGSNLGYWCQSYGATNPNIHIDQTTVVRPSGRFPGSP